MLRWLRNVLHNVADELSGVRVIEELAPCRPAFGCDVMTNFDHSIDEETAKKLKEGKLEVACYPGWNFQGTVWYADGLWKCDVWQYHHHVVTVAAKELKDIMEWVSSKYGWD